MKYIYSLILALFLLSAGSISFAQNRDSFFKTIPRIDKATPEWAKLMYSENPNVDEVIYEYNKYFKENLYEKSIHTQNYKFWLKSISNIINDKGFIDLALINSVN